MVKIRSPLYLVSLVVAGLFLSGCYTSLKTTETEPETIQVENDARGSILQTHFDRVYSFRSVHFYSPWFHSPFQNFYFYNYPGWTERYFYRVGFTRHMDGFYSFYYPPYYSNYYAYNFYHNRWDMWNRWGYSPVVRVSDGHFASQTNYGPRSSGLNPDTRISRAGESVRSDHRNTNENENLFQARRSITPPAAERVDIGERAGLEERRDDDYQERLERNRALRAGVPYNSRSTGSYRGTRSERSESVNRTARTRGSESVTTRRASSRTNSSSATRSTSRSSNSDQSRSRSSSSSNNDS